MSTETVTISLEEYNALLAAKKELDNAKYVQECVARDRAQMTMDTIKARIEVEREAKEYTIKHLAEKKAARDAKKTARKNASLTQ